jgi:hypothetical protein
MFDEDDYKKYIEGFNPETDLKDIGVILDFNKLKNDPEYLQKLKNLQGFANDIFTKSIDEILNKIALPKVNISAPLNKLISDIVNTKVGNESMKTLTVKILREIEKTLNKVIFAELRKRLILIVSDINELGKSLQEPIININRDIKTITDLALKVVKDNDIVALTYLFLLPYVYSSINGIIGNIPFVKRRNIRVDTVILIIKIIFIILILSCIYLFINIFF